MVAGTRKSYVPRKHHRKRFGFSCLPFLLLDLLDSVSTSAQLEGFSGPPSLLPHLHPTSGSENAQLLFLHHPSYTRNNLPTRHRAHIHTAFALTSFTCLFVSSRQCSQAKQAHCPMCWKPILWCKVFEVKKKTKKKKTGFYCRSTNKETGIQLKSVYLRWLSGSTFTRKGLGSGFWN